MSNLKSICFFFFLFSASLLHCARTRLRAFPRAAAALPARLMAPHLGKVLLVMLLAAATTLYQVSRIRARDPTVATALPFASYFSPGAAHLPPPPPGPLDGLLGFQAGSDWGMLRSVLHSRLALHAGALEAIDGRGGAGHGHRLLTLLARPGAAAAAAAAAAAGDAAQALPWGASAASWAAPLLLLTAHESDASDGLAGAKPRDVRHFYGSGKGAEKGGRKGSGGAAAPQPARRRGIFDALLGLGRRAAAASDPQQQQQQQRVWDEASVPRGPARGKAARAFGAHSRGPSLLARTTTPGFATALTLQLHVHVAGLTCALAAEGEVSEAAAAVVAAAAAVEAETATAAAAAAAAELAAAAPSLPAGSPPPPTSDGATEISALPATLPAPTPPPAPLPPCASLPPPFLPFASPSSPKARAALAAALRQGPGSARETASAAISAPCLTWPEAVLAGVLVAHRL